MRNFLSSSGLAGAWPWPFGVRGAVRALALAALVLASGPGMVAPAAAHHVRDVTGRTVEVRDTARIVAIGSSVTEILFALGVGERVVVVDWLGLGVEVVDGGT